MMRLILLGIFLVTTLFASIGKVTASRGDVSIERSSSMIKATRGVLIKLQDIIITQKLSRVQVTLNDKTVIMLGPKSRFSFDAYSQNKDSAEAKMKIEHGVFKAITGEIGKIAPHRFKIKTKTSTIGIRGTHFMGIIEDELEKISCIKGEIYVEFKGETYTVKAGEMIIIIRGKVERADVSKFEYRKFIQRLFDDVQDAHQDIDTPILDEEALDEKKAPLFNDAYNRADPIDTDVLSNDEISIEKEDPSSFTDALNIIGSDISNPESTLQPFDPDLSKRR